MARHGKQGKRVVSAILLLLTGLILYFVFGSALCYRSQPESTAAFHQGLNTEDYYGDTRCGASVLLLEDNQTALEERLRLISMAQREIILSTFDFCADNSGTDVLSALLNAAQRGVRIRILVDGFPAQIHMEGRRVFYALSSLDNVELRSYNPINLLTPWKSMGRMHDKYLIIDDAAYILGGRNTYDYFLGSYPTNDRNYDRELLIYESEDSTDDSLQVLQDYFESVWSLVCCKPFHNGTTKSAAVQRAAAALEQHYTALQNDRPELFQPRDYEADGVAANRVSLISNPIDTGTKEPWVFDTMIALMQTAQESVVLHTPYAVCSEAMYHGLAQTTEGGVKATLVLNAVENGSNWLANADYMNEKQTLLDTGWQVLEYDGGESYHCKTVLIDNRLSLVGSYNLDMRSTYLDTELMLVVDAPELNEQLRGYMSTIEERCRLVVDADHVTLPEGMIPSELSVEKKILFPILRLVVKPIRYLI